MITITAESMLPSRFHPRVEGGLMVKLFTGGRAVLAKARDLSMAGVQLLGDFGRSEERVTVALMLPEREVVTKATVRRRSTEGVGLEFDQLDWEDMFALARFVHPRLG